MIALITQRNLAAAAVAALVKHGCLLSFPNESCGEIVFPEGTVQEEIWPRVGGGIYELRLPDGYVCAAQYVRHYNQYVIFYDPKSK